ncbi:hypothetical protein B0H34DRAFT_701643 [Crassisporium funariophilum]|nr:hypothetical protein B0H34DRAFT_701643 [Crassisporium funariophilum]
MTSRTGGIGSLYHSVANYFTRTSVDDHSLRNDMADTRTYDRSRQEYHLKEDTVIRGKDAQYREQETSNGYERYSSESARKPPAREEPNYRKDTKSSETHRDRKSERTSGSHSTKHLLRDQLHVLSHENSSLKAKLATSQKEVHDTIDRARDLQRKVQRLQGERDDALQLAQTEKSERVAMENRAGKEIRELKRRQEEELRILKDRLRGADEKHGQVAKLLDVRTADLKGAQTFLTTADLYSGAEIVTMVESLNAEIFQAAAFLAELLEDASVMATAEEQGNALQKYQTRMRDQTRHQIGSELFDHLATKSARVREDPLPLQLAIQTFICGWCTFMTRSFYPGKSGEDLQRIYKHIWESGMSINRRMNLRTN